MRRNLLKGTRGLKMRLETQGNTKCSQVWDEEFGFNKQATEAFTNLKLKKNCNLYCNKSK